MLSPGLAFSSLLTNSSVSSLDFYHEGEPFCFELLLRLRGLNLPCLLHPVFTTTWFPGVTRAPRLPLGWSPRPLSPSPNADDPVMGEGTHTGIMSATLWQQINMPLVARHPHPRDGEEGKLVLKSVNTHHEN